jgi:hypothetical protein
MLQVVDCQRCGAALSYGETFRHQLAREVAGERVAARRILGDQLSPRKPKALCGGCRTQAEAELPVTPAIKRSPWLLPAAAAMFGLLLVAAIVRGR